MSIVGSGSWKLDRQNENFPITHPPKNDTGASVNMGLNKTPGNPTNIDLLGNPRLTVTCAHFSPCMRASMRLCTAARRYGVIRRKAHTDSLPRVYENIFIQPWCIMQFWRPSCLHLRNERSSLLPTSGARSRAPLHACAYAGLTAHGRARALHSPCTCSRAWPLLKATSAPSQMPELTRIDT